MTDLTQANMTGGGGFVVTIDIAFGAWTNYRCLWFGV